MSRLPYLDKTDLPEEFHDILERPININRGLAHAPTARRALIQVGNHIRYYLELDPRLREMAILTVGYLTRSPYEWTHHIKFGHEFGVSDADIEGVIAFCEGKPVEFDELTTAVLTAAREMTSVLAVSDTTFATLGEHLDNQRLTELVITIAYYNAVVRMLATMQIDVEPEYAPYLERFPLP